MRLSSVFGFLAAAISSFAAPAAEGLIELGDWSCGSSLPDGTREALAEKFAKELSNKTLTNAKHDDITKRAAFTVPVYWNVMYDPNNPSDGNIPDAVISQSISVLNQHTTQIGLSFQLAGPVNRVPNQDWNLRAGSDSPQERGMKAQLRRGDARTLNIYSASLREAQGPNLLGYATFPWDYQMQPQMDGVVMQYNALPGGQYANYNTGKILVHEVGHWLGLLHTFQDGCNGGDFVDDTSAESYPATSCQARDTCPGQGSDPIHNMMDYTDDNCRTGFTNGQYSRLAQVIYRYRGINLY